MLDKGVTTGHLGRVLHTSIAPENKARLIEQGNNYLRLYSAEFKKIAML
jgi:hypothetical protein